MLQTLALLAALVPSQGAPAGSLALTNPRVTHGELGPNRQEAKFLPGDIFFLSFDIEGLKANEQGLVSYRMEMEVVDAKGKPLFAQEKPKDSTDFLPLGGTKLPARAFVSIGVEQPAGEYTCKIKVTDLAGKEAAKTLDYKFEVLARGFGIVQLYPAVDLKGEISASLVGVAGQSVFIHFSVTGFQRDQKTKQPNILIEMVVYDKDSKPTLLKPTTKQIPDEADGQVDEKFVGVPMRFLVPFNREGGYLIELKATDQLSKQVSKVYLPLRVFGAGK